MQRRLNDAKADERQVLTDCYYLQSNQIAIHYPLTTSHSYTHPLLHNQTPDLKLPSTARSYANVLRRTRLGESALSPD